MTRPAFKAAPVTIDVPATSANLGSGFDSLALAFDIRDHLAAQVLDDAVLDIEVAGEGADSVRRDAKHLVVKAMHAAFDAMGGRPRGLALRCANAIPHGRGLGSSAAAIVGGMVLARSLVLSGVERLDDATLIALASEMEGHPDNVAAAFYGGATIAWSENGVGRALPIAVSESIQGVLFIPTTSVATSKARRLLPEVVPFEAAAANVGRAALLVRALADRPDLLFTATEDRLHQEARKSAMPRSLTLVDKLRADGFAAMVSGAGPTVLVLHEGGVEEKVSGYAGSTFAVQQVSIARHGAGVTRG
jgi:homoserine kinase